MNAQFNPIVFSGFIQIGSVVPVSRYVPGDSQSPHIGCFETEVMEIPRLFTRYGRLISTSKILERYAIACAIAGENAFALELFDARGKVEGLETILFLHNPFANDVYRSEEVSPSKRKLGYHGVLVYGWLCAKRGRLEDARKLFDQIADLPDGAPPATLCDARVAALKCLKLMEPQRGNIALRLQEALRHQP